MRRGGWPVLGTLIALLALGTLLVTACGGGGGGGNGGGSAADDVVKQWVEGWQRSSGPQRDDITAGQMRLLLTGDLYTKAQAATQTGAAMSLSYLSATAKWVGLVITTVAFFTSFSVQRRRISRRNRRIRPRISGFPSLFLFSSRTSCLVIRRECSRVIHWKA